MITKTITVKLMKTLLFTLLLAGTFAFGYYEGFDANLLRTKTIDPKEGNTLHKEYLKNAQAYQEILGAMYLNAELLKDITALRQAKPNAGGLRIYFGKDANGKSQNVLITTDKVGIEDNTLVLSSDGIMSTCPTFCDAASQIRK